MKDWFGKRIGGLTRGAAGLAVVALTAVGVYAPNFDRHDDVAYPAPPTVGHPAYVDPEAYVALGDSYSAGEGLPVPRYRPGTDVPGNTCHRSEISYGWLLGARDGFLACSGAVLINMFTDPQGASPPQLDPKVTEPDTKLVTITISGNDAGFAKIVAFCAGKLDCINDRKWTAPDGGPEKTIQAFADRKLAELRDKELPAFYQQLQDHFPNARIVVLGYPLLFTNGPEFALQRFCQKAYQTFSTAERAALRARGAEYNAIIEQVATGAGLEYVHVADAFEGHETCGPKGPWLAFVKDAIRELDSYAKRGGVDPGNFHPTASGQGMFARLVSCYLNYNPGGPQGGDPPNGAKGDLVYKCATAHPTEPPDYDLTP